MGAHISKLFQEKPKIIVFFIFKIKKINKLIVR